MFHGRASIQPVPIDDRQSYLSSAHSCENELSADKGFSLCDTVADGSLTRVSMCSGVYSLPSSPRSPSVSQSYHLTIRITKILRAYSNETVITYFTIDGRYMRAQLEERTGVRLTVFGDVVYTGVSVAFDGQASTWLGMWGL